MIRSDIEIGEVSFTTRYTPIGTPIDVTAEFTPPDAAYFLTTREFVEAFVATRNELLQLQGGAA